MGKFVDTGLTCRQCGKEFIFTAGEQEFYSQKGFSQPSRCRQCREDKRGQNSRLLCSGCGSELGSPAYCSTCIENIKQEAEFKVKSEQNKVEILEGRLETLNELKENLAAATAEVDRSRETIRSLQQKTETLEAENSKLATEAASRQEPEAMVRQLTEQFENFRKGYIHDIQELVQSNLDIRNALVQGQNGSLLHRFRLALKSITNVQTQAHEAGAGKSK
jgi:hypothetical protein